MICSNCGANVPDGVAFCPNCGKPMNAAPPAPKTPAGPKLYGSLSANKGQKIAKEPDPPRILISPSRASDAWDDGASGDGFSRPGVSGGTAPPIYTPPTPPTYKPPAYTPPAGDTGGYVPNPGAYNPNPGYDPNAGYNPNSAYDPNAGYNPNPGYDPNAGYNPNPGYTPNPGYDPNPGYNPNPGYDPNAGYNPNGYDPNAGYPPVAVKKKKSPLPWILLALVLVAGLAVGAYFLFFADKDDDDGSGSPMAKAAGTYYLTHLNYYGSNATADDFRMGGHYLVLNADGSCSYVHDNATDAGTWTLDGSNVSLTITNNGGRQSGNGTLNGKFSGTLNGTELTLTIDSDGEGVTMTFSKNGGGSNPMGGGIGTAIPNGGDSNPMGGGTGIVLPETSGQAVSGRYYLSGGYANGQSYNPAEMGMEGVYFDMSPDGTCQAYNPYGETQNGTWTISGGIISITLDGDTESGEFSGDSFAITDSNSGATMYFAK